MAESMKPVAWMHCYRKITGGARYEQADIGEYGPDPQPGFEHYDKYPLYSAAQLEQARREALADIIAMLRADIVQRAAINYDDFAEGIAYAVWLIKAANEKGV